MQVIVEDILTNYEQQGSGPVILFLHGWGDALQTFLPLIKKLKEHYTCVVLDLPGSGGSHAPEAAWGVEDYATFIAAFVKKVKVKPMAIVGHSNGGTIAMFATAHKLLEPQKLILLASAGIRAEGGLKKNTYKVIAKTGKQITRFLPKSTQQKLRRKLYSKAGSDILVAPHLEETFKKIVSYDIQADARAINASTLLVYASDDEATPPRYGTMLSSAIKNSKVETIPNGGHFLHLEQSDQVAKLITEFLA